MRIKVEVKNLAMVEKGNLAMVEKVKEVIVIVQLKYKNRNARYTSSRKK
jgi:hypothetical protein